MKKTVNNKKISLMHVGITAAVLFGILFIVRMYQLTLRTDPSTGFFTDHSDFTIIPMYILAVASVIIIAVLCFICGEKPAGVRNLKPDYFHGVTSVVFAIGLALNSYEGFKLLMGQHQVSSSLSQTLKALGGYTYILVPLFALVSTFIMIYDGICAFLGKDGMSRMKLPMLIPVLWAFFRTISYFTITASYLKAAQLMFIIFADAFLMLFLFDYARMNSGIGRKEAVWAFYANGFIAAGLNFVSVIPTLILTIFAPEKVIEGCPFRFYSFAAIFFIISAMINFAKTKEETGNVTETE